MSSMCFAIWQYSVFIVPHVKSSIFKYELKNKISLEVLVFWSMNKPKAFLIYSKDSALWHVICELDQCWNLFCKSFLYNNWILLSSPFSLFLHSDMWMLSFQGGHASDVCWQFSGKDQDCRGPLVTCWSRGLNPVKSGRVRAQQRGQKPFLSVCLSELIGVQGCG